MSLTKRFIEEQMEMGVDLIGPQDDIDYGYEQFKSTQELEELKSEVFQKEIEEKSNEKDI